MKNRTCRIRGKKRRGEWAELVFMAMAALFGLDVSRPYGESSRYDVSVEYRGRFRRVQVKSTLHPRRRKEYCINVLGSGNRPYEPGSVDFIAAYLIPIDTWYIIPFSAIKGHCSLRFAPGGPRQKYEKYREAWELLRA